MIAHKVIDTLRGVGKYNLMPIPGVTRERCEIAAKAIERAQKFDFGDLMLERAENGNYQVPVLTVAEREMWRDGLIPLPYPICWFEFSISGYRSGCVVMSDGDAWGCFRIDLVRDVISFDDLLTRVRLSEVETDCNTFSVELAGNQVVADILKGRSHSPYYNGENVAATVPLTLYLTLMLNSKTTEIESKPAPEKLNRKREKKGLAPLPAHRVVTIVPVRFLHNGGGTHLDGPRRSPRLHWRRSHVRTLADGRRILIARMLVGRAELGEVSHEYKFKKE